MTDILSFLAEFSQFIIYQGVHMVYSAQVNNLFCKPLTRASDGSEKFSACFFCLILFKKFPNTIFQTTNDFKLSLHVNLEIFTIVNVEILINKIRHCNSIVD